MHCIDKEKQLQHFAGRVCEWSIGPRNLKIEGTYHAGNFNYKKFKITGKSARVLIDILIRLDDA